MINLNTRKSGVLLPIFSLPSQYGIGTLGKDAFLFVDYLKKAGQTYWQILPINPLCSDTSPYSSNSSFAGNHLFIDFELLSKDNWLEKSDFDYLKDVFLENKINYQKLSKEKTKIFKKVYDKFKNNLPDDFEYFCNKNKFWLEDYCLFMALCETYNTQSMYDFPKEYLLREKTSLDKLKLEKANLVLYHKMLQYFFYKQWYNLKEYANSNGVYIIGDIPYCVSLHSVDVWASPQFFMLDNKLKLKQIAGCPPDVMCKDGQIWGFPVYDWEKLQNDNYTWWILRLNHSFTLYDILRIDHFRGFSAYYSIPANSKTAVNGKWIKAPGKELFDTFHSKHGNQPIIAEDLGYITSDVRELLSHCGFLGMKVLQYAFDHKLSDEDRNQFYPHNYKENFAAYLGTHDMETCVGKIGTYNDDEIKEILKYFNINNKEEICDTFIEAIMQSKACCTILCIYDLLKLDNSARINTPATLSDDNWSWRLTKKQFSSLDANKLYDLTKKSSRL